MAEDSACNTVGLRARQAAHARGLGCWGIVSRYEWAYRDRRAAWPLGCLVRQAAIWPGTRPRYGRLCPRHGEQQRATRRAAAHDKARDTARNSALHGSLQALDTARSSARHGAQQHATRRAASCAGGAVTQHTAQRATRPGKGGCTMHSTQF